jgi:hypothetical protein
VTSLTQRHLRAAVAIVMAATVILPLAADDLHHLRDYRSDWSVNLLPDRPWLRYLAQHGGTDSVVEVIYPRQVYLAIGMHADSSLWPACAVAFHQGSRRAFDAVLTTTRPSFVVSSGTSGDCVPDLIQGDPQYRQVLQDPADRVIIWRRAQTAGTTR